MQAEVINCESTWPGLILTKLRLSTYNYIYKTCIQPVLEYGNIILGPLYFVLNQQQMEKVQKRAPDWYMIFVTVLITIVL